MATVVNNRLGDRYLELIKAFPLRPIRSAAKLDRAIAVIDELIDKPKLSRDEQDYLDVLGDLVERFEDEQYEFTPVSDAAMLAFLIEAKQVSQSIVAAETEIPNSVLSNVLHGKRTLNRGQIAKLTHYFSVEPTVFDFSAQPTKQRKRN